MAAIDTSRPVAALNRGNGSFFASIIGNLAAWNDARLTRKALSQLTDRELDDVGLTRADVNNMGGIIR